MNVSKRFLLAGATVALLAPWQKALAALRAGSLGTASSGDALVSKAARMSVAGPLIADPARRWHVQGGAPWFPEMAAVLKPAPEKLDALLNDYAPIAAKLHSQNSFWICFHMFVFRELVAAALDGHLGMTLEEAVWLSHITAYWGLSEAKRRPEANSGLEQIGMGPSQTPSAASMTKLITHSLERHRAAASDADALKALPQFLVEQPVTGMIHGCSYNSRYMVITGGQPPFGHRPPHIAISDDQVRVNQRDFLRVDYAAPLAPWLARARAAFERAAQADSLHFEAALSNAASTDLRQVWVAGIAMADMIWGAQDMAKRRDDTYVDVFEFAVPVNFGFEATALDGMTALLTKDGAMARRAIQANAIAVGYWDTAQMALADPDGRPPSLVTV